MTFKPASLTRTEVLTAIAVKIIMGLVYGYIFLTFYDGDDTWQMHHASLNETALLLKDPVKFFLNEYTPLLAIQNGHSQAERLSLYISDLEWALTVKTLALFNLISQGNYYVNVVLFNLVVFFGHYWFFKIFIDLFPDKRNILFIVIFLFPPVIFWLSGIRTDGFLFFFFSLTLSGMVTGGKRSRWRMLALTGVMIIRPQFGLLLALAMIAYFMSKKIKKPIVTFGAVYLAAIIVFFISNANEHVVMKQHQFRQLQGTRFALDALQPNIKSFVQVLPQALLNTFFRPYLWEAKGALQLFSAAETGVFWIMMIVACKTRQTDWRRRLSQPFVIMLLFFSASVYVFVGYIVPFPGAIVRYRIIPEMLLIILMVSMSNKFNIGFLSLKLKNSTH